MDHATIEAALTALRGEPSRALDRDCDILANRLADTGVEPQFKVGSADFAADPFLICADAYWRRRHLDEPTLRTAVECAGWLDEHVDAEFQRAIREKWSLGYGFITRDTVQSAGEIADLTADVLEGRDPDCSRAYFAVLYHAGKLRANLCFDELHQFLESSPLAWAAGPFRDDALFTALLSFAAFGSHRITEARARELLDHAWHAPARTFAVIDVALNGLAVSAPFPAQGELLTSRAGEALAEFPEAFLFHQRLALGRYLLGEHDAALESIDRALALLPATGWRSSQKLILEQFITQREAILSGRTVAHLTATVEQLSADQRRQLRRHRQAMAALVSSVRRNMLRSVELVTLFAAIIAFAVGSLNVTLNGNLALHDRIWILVVSGGMLLLFALTVVGGTWLITRSLPDPDIEYEE
ncbi:hypothetical protein ACIP5Y_23840 [Nocardia sp. NPDC088792]|uniref:hypothetical protein n=1 Tax=Nocardia sp. NPDC088792 TaxID=3364332 RepID=UPI00381038C5